MTTHENKEIKKNIPSPALNAEEIMKRLVYNPTLLNWNNFQQVQPEPDRMLLIWCNLGSIAPNLFLTYRDASGAYDMPHPNKRYPVKAWAYVDLPAVDEEHLEKVKTDLEKEAKEHKCKDSEIVDTPKA